MPDKRPDVNAMFERMFRGVDAAPADTASGVNNGQTPPPKVVRHTEEPHAESAPATEQEKAEQTEPVDGESSSLPAEEEPAHNADAGLPGSIKGSKEQKQKKASQSKSSGKKRDTAVKNGGEAEDDAADRPVEFYRNQALNGAGKVHASFWLTPEVLGALELRSFLEKCRGNPGGKSELVENALRKYLEEELNAGPDDFFGPQILKRFSRNDGGDRS